MVNDARTLIPDKFISIKGLYIANTKFFIDGVCYFQSFAALVSPYFFFLA